MSAKLTFVKSKTSPDPVGPYSHAVIAGGFMYVSGQIGLDPATGTLDNATIEEETHRCFKNLGAILKEEGLSFDSIVKVTIFVQNLGDFGRINKVYGTYFTEGRYPAREMVEVSKLPKMANIEISVVAYKG